MKSYLKLEALIKMNMGIVILPVTMDKANTSFLWIPEINKIIVLFCHTFVKLRVGLGVTKC